MKPVLFLDIDGVLNIAGWKPERPVCDWDDLEFHEVPNYSQGYRFPMYLSPEMGAQLASLDVEIRWLTTWANDAHAVGKLVGLPDNLPVAATPPPLGVRNWKLQAVREFVEDEPGVPFIWLDDDAITEAADKFLESCGVPHLAVKVDENKGIEKTTIESIRVFTKHVK